MKGSNPYRSFFGGMVLLSLVLTGAGWTQEATEEEILRQEQLEQAAEQLQTTLDAELERLKEIREKIAEEKPTLATRLQESAAEIRQKQREYDIARSTREAVVAEFEEAEKQLKVWRDERVYLDGLLFDFRKNLEAQSSLAKAETRRDLFLAADAMDESGTDARLDLVGLAIQDLAESGGVGVLKGKALGPDGVMQEGTFVEAGPISWFADEAGKVSGLVTASRELIPEVLPETASRKQIMALAEGEPGSPRFDPTLGTAVALEDVEETLWQHIRKGGLWIWPILLLAAIALLAAIFKALEIMRLREVVPSVVGQVVESVNAGEKEKARAAVAGSVHPAAEMLRFGVEHADLPRPALEEKLYERHLTLLPRLQRGLPFIAIAAATAPLLGLLGTVTGMIHTFQKITVFGTGDAKPLAGGISEALVTTEFGLIVAIPSLIIHALLSRKATGIRANMEMSTLAFLNGVRPPESTEPTS